MSQHEFFKVGTTQALIDAIKDNLDLKADVDGYYQQLTAGAADNLTGRGDATGGEYLHRTTAGTASVSDEGVATVKSIHGRTLRWNQLRAPSDGGTAATVNGITWTKNADGSITVSGTSTASTVTNIILKSIAANELPVGHKILVKGACPAGGSVSTYRAGVGGVSTDMGEGGIWTSNISVATTFRFVVNAGATVPETTLWPQLFDLTAMFGAGNEPSTVAEFEALYPKPYYPYDAGSLLPVKMTGVETTGFNQWDESWEVGAYNASGNKTSSSTNIRSAGYITVFPSTTYYHKVGGVSQTTNAMVNFYDDDKAFISRTYSANATFETPDNCRYVTFYCGSSYGTTYNHDICINLSWSGYRNGEYEPYWSSQRLIDVGTLRGAGTVYDELTETERITRVGVVDLGTLDWATYSTPENHVFRVTYAGFPSAPADHSHTGLANAEMVEYTQKSYNDISASDDGCYAMSGPLTNRFVVIDHSYSDAAALKAALDGVMLYYEVAEPTVTTYDPPLNLDYRYADFGTERIMVPDGVMSAPPTVEAVYGINATDTIRNLPTDYTSKKSLENLLAALDAHNSTTTTMSWSEGQQAYTFAIADNETEG